jgi:hypothetical protein
MHIVLAVLLTAAAAPAAKPLSFPFPGSGEASTDYLALDLKAGQVWVPAGNRGQVFVFDIKARTFKSIPGFPTAQLGKRVGGPSSVTLTPSAAYVGNRGDSKVCAVDPSSLKIGACALLPTMPDGVTFVPTTKEIWVTTPRSKNVTILSTEGGKLAIAGAVPIEGAVEGYAVDADHGIFFTNDEEGDKTFAIDVRTRKLMATYKSGCGKEGARGLIYDAARRLLLVGCAEGASVLDLAKDGALLGHMDTGGGVDTIDYEPGSKQLYLASGRTGMMIVARVEAKGALTKVAEYPTAEGVRAVVVDSKGIAYLPDSKGGRLLVVEPAAASAK